MQFSSLAKIFLVILFWLGANFVSAQQINWSGIVVDSLTKEALPGAVIKYDGTGTTTNAEGKFSIQVELPVYVEVTYIGYQKNAFSLTDAEKIPAIIYLKTDAVELNELVVSASRQKQKREEISQSIELIKPNFLARTQTNQVQEIMEKIPGVQMQKDQISIRGGSGFSYGTGSRVMVLLDEMPILSADASDAKWNYYPVENIDQLEIMKGAASTLYGSSAMEGIVHLTTVNAADTSFTQLKHFLGVYDMEKDIYTSYNKNIPIKTGLTLSHRRKIGAFGFVGSVSGYKDEGYRVGDHDNLLRGNLKVTFTPPKNDKLSLILSLNGMQNSGQDFVFFGDVDSTYIPFRGTTSDFTSTRAHSDLIIKFYPNDKNRHVLRGRFFTTINKNNTGQSSTGRLLFSEYQYLNVLFEEGASKKSTLTGGISNTYTQTLGEKIYGNHSGNNTAVYMQLDNKVKRLNISLGARMEINKMDTFKRQFFPVFRSGLNYRFGKATFLRYNLGQGFRYPSVAERFARTSSGSVNIFPNPNLQPERGWTTELALKQLFGNERIKGYADAAIFWSEYENMVQYEFGFYPPDTGFDPTRFLDYLGFTARNIPTTRVYGFELSSAVSADIGKTNLSFYGGYTYIVPKDDIYAKKDTLERLYYLKYRRQHLVRGNLDFTYKNFSAGIYGTYNSPIKNIDEFFLDAIKGLKPNDYWQTYSEGTVFDARLSYSFTRPDIDVSLFAKNFLNEQYMEVPGNTNAPRSYILQLSAQF